MVKSLNKNWMLDEAIRELFLANFDLSVKELKELRTRMSLQLSGNETSLRTRLDDKNIAAYEIVNRAIFAVKRDMPSLQIADRRHALFWARWAIQSSNIPVNDHFYHWLGRWRAKTQSNGITLLGYKSPDDPKKTRGASWQLRNQSKSKVIGYTIEEFLFCKRLRCENEYQLEWKTKTERNLPANRKETSKRMANPLFKNNEEMGRICGTHALKTLTDSVTTEVRNGNRLGLFLVKKTQADQGSTHAIEKDKDGRYVSEFSRAELILLLQRKYSGIKKYKGQTLVRALSSIVKCPKGRPKPKN